MTKELLNIVKIVTKVSFLIIWKYFQDTDELLYKGDGSSLLMA